MWSVRRKRDLRSMTHRMPLVGTRGSTVERSAHQQVGCARAGGRRDVHDHARCVDRQHQSAFHRAHFPLAVGGAVEWVIIAYLVVIAATLLTFGRLSDPSVASRSGWPGWRSSRSGSVLCGAACFPPTARRRPHLPGTRWRSHLRTELGDHHRRLSAAERGLPWA